MSEPFKFKKGYLSINNKVIGEIKNMEIGVDNKLTEIKGKMRMPHRIPTTREYTCSFTVTFKTSLYQRIKLAILKFWSYFNMWGDKK